MRAFGVAPFAPLVWALAPRAWASPRPVRSPSAGPALPPGWLSSAPLQCLYRVDSNFNGSNGSLSTELLGSLGATALLVRSIFTEYYDGISFLGHYGDDAVEGALAFGSGGDEDTFNAQARVGADTIALRCPGGSADSGWKVTGSIAGEAFSATFGGREVISIHGHEVRVLEGTFGNASFEVSGEFYSEYVPRAFSFSISQGGATAASSVLGEIWSSSYLGSLSGTLSGPPVLLVAGLAWWSVFMDIEMEGFIS